jgi:hypothetical protein
MRLATPKGFAAKCINKSTKKRNLCILVLLDESEIRGHCMFPLTNIYFGESVDFVPNENIIYDSKGLCIRWGNLKYLDRKMGYANEKNSIIQFFCLFSKCKRHFILCYA